MYQYTTTNGHDCINIDASWGGSGGCSPPGKHDCPVANPTGGPNEPPGVEVFVPDHVDDLDVSVGGTPLPMTIEHAEGFTFAYGPSPSADHDIAVTVDGRPAC